MRGSADPLKKFERVIPNTLLSAVSELSVMARSGPVSATWAGAVIAAGSLPWSNTLKRLPPDRASGPALKLELTSCKSGDGVELASIAPSPTPNPGQQEVGAMPNWAAAPRLVVLNELPLATNSGPERATRVGCPGRERRAMKMPPALVTLDPWNESSGAPLALDKIDPSPKNARVKTFLAGSPTAMLVLRAVTRPPVRN